MEPGKETAESEAVRLKLGLVYSEIEQNVALRLRLGHVYFDADKFAKAAEQFAPLLAAAIHTERLPDDKAKKALLREIGERCDEMGDCFLAAGRLSEAEAAFEKYNESTPNRAMLEFNRARVAAQSDKPAEALARLEKAFQSHIAAKGAVPYELLAKLLTKLGKEKELLERLEKLHAAEPTNVPLGCFLADRFRRAGELDKAESLYRGLLARSRSAAACEGLISLERKRRNADALLAAVGEAIDLPDEASEGVDVEEKAIVADAGLLRELVAAARKQLAAAPDKLDYRQRLAVALLALDAKQDDLAGEFFDLAIKVRPERTATLLKIWDGDCSRKTASRKPHACSNGESTRNRRRKTASFSTSTFPSRWRRRGGSTRPWRPPARPRSWAKTCPSFAFVRRGFSTRPSATTRRSPPSPPCWRGLTPTSTTRRENCAARRSRRSPKATSNRWPTSACSSTARTSGSPRKRATSSTTRGSPWPISASFPTASPRAKSGSSRSSTNIPRTPPP